MGRPGVAGAIAGGAALLVAFVIYESRTAMPMLPLRLFKSRNFSVTNLETFAVYGGLSAWGFFLTLFLQQIAGYSPFRAGLATHPDDDRRVPAVAVRRAALDALRAAHLHGGGPADRRRLDPRARAPAGAPELLGRSPAAARRLRDRAVADRRAADDDRAQRRGPGDAGIASGVNNAVARVAGSHRDRRSRRRSGGEHRHLSTHGFHRAMLVVAVLLVVGGVLGAVGIGTPRGTSAKPPQRLAAPFVEKCW